MPMGSVVYCCNLWVCLYSYSKFYSAQCSGRRAQFWSCLVFSCAFFQCLFLGILSLSSLVFSLSLFSVSWETWRPVAIAVSCCLIHVCWPVRVWLFRYFSVPTMQPMFDSLSAGLFPNPPMLAPPSLGIWWTWIHFQTTLWSLWPKHFNFHCCISCKEPHCSCFQHGSSPCF